FPRVRRPRIIFVLTGAWDGVERPGRLSGEHIVGAKVSGRIGIDFAWRRTENNQVLENVSGRSGLNLAHGLRIAPKTLSQIHPAVIAEGIDRHSGTRVRLLYVAVDGTDKPSIGAALA